MRGSGQKRPREEGRGVSHRDHRDRSTESAEKRNPGPTLRINREGWGTRAKTQIGGREIPRLRDPTRHSSARKRKSGRSARDDRDRECYLVGALAAERTAGQL